MASELAVAYVTLAVDGKNVGKGVRDALGSTEGEAKRAGGSAGKAYGASLAGSLKGAAKGALAGLGIAAVGGAALGFLRDANDEAREAQKVGAQTAAVLKSTGGAANISATGIGNLATAISNKVGIDDEAIQSGENLLLTFTNIRNETGRGNDIFNQATRTLVDMSAALGTDTKGSAIQLGKALNDPIKGVTALQRVGVSFTAQQKDQIKTLVSSGRTLDAQKLILKELGREFSGSAAAQATASDKAKVAIGNLKEQVGTALLPVYDDLANVTTTKIVPAISEFVTGMTNGTGAGGAFVSTGRDLLGVLKPVASVTGTAAKFFGDLPSPVQKTALAAGLLAFAMRRTGLSFTTANAQARQFAASMTYATERQALAARASTALGGAARNAAGVGGILALSASSQTANEGLKTLGNIGGGAMLGFSVGGPYGAAIGAGVGALKSLFDATRKSGDGFAVTKKQASDYAATLDQVTGAATRESRANVLGALSKNKVLSQGLRAGLSQRTLVDAALGSPQDIARTKAAISALNGEAKRLTHESGKKIGDAAGGSARKAQDIAARYEDRIKSVKTTSQALNSVIGETADRFSADARAVRLAYYATTPLPKLLKGFPKAAVTDIKLNNVDHSKSAVLDLIRQYNLTPKQIKTVSGIAGFDVSIKRANDLRDAALGVPKGTSTRASTPGAPGAKKALDLVTEAAQRAGKQHPSPSVTADTKSFFNRLAAAVSAGNRAHAEVKIFANTSNFTSGVTSAINAAASRVASIKLPGRMAGGPVAAGHPYWVGEAGPEIVVPGRSGTVIPNNKIASGRSASVAPAASGGGTDGGRFVLMLDDGTPLTGFIQQIADESVYTAAALSSQGR